MDPTLIIDDARPLSTQSLAEILFHALFLLMRRGAATQEQIDIMLELQCREAPQLRTLKVA